MIEGAGVFAPGVLAPVHDGFGRICAAYPWDRDAQVSSHNDVNPFNVLFDGDRLWLIDWEIAFRNDPFADVACVANNFADPVAHAGSAEALEDALLHAWLGHAPGSSDAQPPRADAAAEPAVLRLPDDEHVDRSTSTRGRPRRAHGRCLPRRGGVGSARARVAATCCTRWARCSSPASSPELAADGFDETLREAGSG